MNPKKSFLPFKARYLTVLFAAFAVVAIFGNNDFSKSLQTNVPGYSIPIDVNYSSFGCKAPGTWSSTVWCQAYGSTYDLHVTEASKHASTIVMFKRNLPSYGDYYVVGSYGSSAVGKNGQTYYAGAIVECPSGAAIQYHSNSHHLYSPSLGEGFYDGNGHYWCDQGGVSVDPIIKSSLTGIDYAMTDRDKLFKFEFPDGVKKYKSFKDSTNTDSYGFVKCPDTASTVGPYTGSAQYTNQYWVKEAGKRDYYRCFDTAKGVFVDAITDSVALASPYSGVAVSYFRTDNAKNCDSTYSTCQPSCVAGDATCGGANTYGPSTQACASNTYWCQTTDVNYRYCSADAACATTEMTPPAPTWTIAAPTNLRITGTKTTGFSLTESVPVAADFAATGTGIAYGQATMTVQIAQDTAFATAWIRPSSTGYVTAVGSSVNGYVDNFPATGTFYWRAKMSLGNQDSPWTSAPYGSFVVCASGKIWNGTSCVTTPAVTTCPTGLSWDSAKNMCISSDWKEIIWNNLGLKSYVSIYAPQTVIDAAKAACANTDPSKVSWPNPSDFSKPATAGIPSCDGTVVSAGPTLMGTIFKDGQYIDPATSTLRNCVSPNYWMKEGPTSSGARGFHCMPIMQNNAPASYDSPPASCVGTLWAGGGTTSFTSDYCATSKDTSITPTTPTTPPTGPTYCKLGETCTGTNTNCLSSKQCFVPGGGVKCIDWNGSCPSDTKPCSPLDKGCGNPGDTVDTSGWCKDSVECYVGDKKFCQPLENGNYNTKCPSTAKACSPNDPGCTEPGSKKKVSGLSSYWCKNSFECYSKDYSELFCQPNPDMGSNMPAYASTAVYPGSYFPPSFGQQCSGDYPNQCRPGSGKGCTETGQTNPDVAAWCTGGSKQCYTDKGLYCAKQSESCPTGSSVCKKDSSWNNPLAYSTVSYTTGCTEDDAFGPKNGWCGGKAVQCFKQDGSGIYCAAVNSNDPQGWEKISCPSGTSRCSADNKYCADELGKTYPKGYWCAVGMTKYNSDGTITCVSGKDYDGYKDIMPKIIPDDKTTCLQITTQAYDPATNECKVFATSCNVPKDWKNLEGTKICKDGKIADLDVIVDYNTLKQTVEQDISELKDFRLNLKKLSAEVASADGIKQLIEDTIAKLIDVSKKLSGKSVNVGFMKKEFETLHNGTVADLRTKMQEFNGQFDFINIRDGLKQDIESYKVELKQITDKKGDYYKELKIGIANLEDLLKVATSQKGGNVQQILDNLKASKGNLEALIEQNRQKVNGSFLGQTIADLEDFYLMVSDKIDGATNPDMHVLFMMERFEELLDSISGSYDGGEYLPDVMYKMIDEANSVRSKLESWLGIKKKDFDIEKIFAHIEDKVAAKLDKMFGQLDNKLEIMLNDALQQAAVKVADLVVSKFSENFEEKVATSLANLTHVNEKAKEELIAAKNQILASTEDIQKALEDSNVGNFAAGKLREVMETAASKNWCGGVYEDVQSQINSAGLALEAKELTADDVTALATKVDGFVKKNEDECYRIGAKSFKDVPMEEWYFPAAEFNKVNGYIKGYTDASGKPTGEYGAANATLRIEALAMAMRILDLPVGSGALASGFNGVPEWGNSYVNGALKAGMSLDRTWTWDKPISRIEAAELFVNALKATGKNYLTLPTIISEAKEYHDYSKFSYDHDGVVAVEALTDVGILKGSSDGNFYPDSQLLRSEFGTMNQRLVETFDLQH